MHNNRSNLSVNENMKGNKNISGCSTTQISKLYINKILLHLCLNWSETETMTEMVNNNNVYCYDK